MHHVCWYQTEIQSFLRGKLLTLDPPVVTFVVGCSLNPDQARQSIRPDLEPDTAGIPERYFFEKVNFLKNSDKTKKRAKITQHANS